MDFKYGSSQIKLVIYGLLSRLIFIHCSGVIKYCAGVNSTSTYWIVVQCRWMVAIYARVSAIGDRAFVHYVCKLMPIAFEHLK